MNPPFSLKKQFVIKLQHEINIGAVEEAILLLPASLGEHWWVKLGLDKQVFCLLTGRLRFEPAQFPCMFSTALIYYGDRTQEFVNPFSSLGTIYKRY